MIVDDRFQVSGWQRIRHVTLNISVVNDRVLLTLGAHAQRGLQ